MNTTSAFQQQYPLDPKKFWKKMFGGVVGAFVYAILSAILLWLFVVWLGSNGAPIISQDSALPIFIELLVAAFVVITIGYAVYFTKYIATYYYDQDGHFITIKKGVFAPREIHIQYSKIQDVYVDQDILDRMLGLYDVHISTATIASGMEAHIDGVNADTASALKQIILDALKNPNADQSLQSSQSVPRVDSAPMPQGISTATFPIAGRWLGIAVINSAFRNALLIVFIYFFAFFYTGKADVQISPIADQLGISAQTGFVIAFLIWLVFVVGSVFYILAWKRTYRFEFQADNISLKNGVITSQETHVPYRTIQDVTISQGIVEKMFSLYSVKIQNAANVQQTGRGRRGAPRFRGIIIPGQELAQATAISEAVKSQVGVLNQTGL